MWLYISFSPSEHYALGTASSRKRKAACGPDSMTGRRSAEVQNLSRSIAEYPGLARFLSDVLNGPCFTADKLPLPARRSPPRRPDERPARLVWGFDTFYSQ